MAIDERIPPTDTGPARPEGRPPARRRWPSVQFPVLDPDRWTSRHSRFLAFGAAVITVCWLVESWQTYPASGLRAALSAALAVAVAGLALSLRGVTLPGVAIGGFIVLCGTMSWTWTNTPMVTWSVYGLGGLLFLFWTFPWFRDALRLPRLGAAWLGLAYWPLGILSAVLTAHWVIGAQRVAYFGVVALVAIAVITAIRRTGQDPSVGVVAAFLLAIAALFLVGSGNLLDDTHAVPGNAWGNRMQFRFWGGPGLLYHPNSLAVLGVVVALRIGPDRAFRHWQRWSVLGLVGLIILLTNSRTAWGFLGTAAAVHLLLIARQRWRIRQAARATASSRRSPHAGAPTDPTDDGLPLYPSTRRALTAALIPCLLVGMVFIGMGGVNALFQSRYQNTVETEEETETEELDLTSGRVETWKQVFRDFTSDAVVEKVFGNNDEARGAVIRESTGDPDKRPELTTDNSAVGALRRAGILGALAFLLGLGLLLYHALRRGAPAWFTIVVVASLFTIPWADWLLGGIGGTLWIFLLAAEAWRVHAARSPQPPPTAPKPAPEDTPAATRS